MENPIVDYHVHVTDGFGVEEAAALAEERGMKFGILEHPGIPGLRSDGDLRRYIQHLRQYPVYVGLQPMHVNWTGDFSPDVINQLDYVLMDADTVPQPDGSYLRIWRNDLFIKDMDEFMALYMRHIVQILTHEPIDIFARPTYLPINFARHYDQLWTKERVQTIIELASARDIALEIQENTRVPSLDIIQQAKEAGVKFTFGTNARNHNAGNFHYCLEMAEKCSLTEADMFIIEV
jgi:histidinol phosphatase-like PHP family hydrolase